MRRRLSITTDTAEIILSWQQHCAQLRVPPAPDLWLFPNPLLRTPIPRTRHPGLRGPGVQGLDGSDRHHRFRADRP